MDMININSECEQFLAKAKSIGNIMKGNYQNDKVYDFQKSQDFIALQKEALVYAIKQASSDEELEKCATVIETIYCGDDIDAHEWAEQVRNKTYGLESSVSPYIEAALDIEEFVNFIMMMGSKNRFYY